MIKRMVIMLSVFALVLSGIFGYKIHQGNMMKQKMSGGMPPQTVSTIKAEYQDWQPTLVAVGTLRAVKGADLSAEVAGIVESIHFESGDEVKSGTTLVQLRAEDDVAKLRSLEAAATLAQITYQRDEKQLKAQAISQATFDADSANLASAQAQVVEQRAIVSKKTIRAPFAGNTGIRAVDIGQYLNPGTSIVTLQQLEPIYVDFTLPEQALGKIAVGQKVIAKSDVAPETPFSGEISAINSKVDETTRNITVRATYENPDHKLLPGMFVTVVVDVDQPMHFITLPQTAIVYNTYGNAVYRVQTAQDDKSGKPGLSVQQSIIITGETRGDQVAVLSGLNEGDEVVTSGQVKLHNGTPIIINNDIQPANEPNPTPHEQ